MSFRIGWVAFVLGICSVRLFAASADALALQQRLVDVFEQNKDAVVRVKAAYRGPDKNGKAQVMLRVGTGFFISREGHILVSASRAAGADRVWIEYQGKSYATEAMGHDRLTNISLLRVVELPQQFSIISMDTSLERPRLGSIAIAVACPLDFAPSPSMGLVTGMDKKLGNKVFPTEYIRTSISVNAGRGGCPILDINGRFIGMSVASISELDASYCIPPAALARVRDDLLFSGHIIHSWMGFEVAEALGTKSANAVYLSKVIEGAPAHEAGLLEGDHLISIAGREIVAVSDVPGAVFFTRANQYTTIEVMRDEALLEFSVKTLARPEAAAIIEPSEMSEAPEAVESPLAVESSQETVTADDFVASESTLTDFFDWTSGDGELKGHKFKRGPSWMDASGHVKPEKVTETEE